MNLNYFRLYTNLARTRPGNSLLVVYIDGPLLLFLEKLLYNYIKSNTIKLDNLIENNFLIYYLIVLGFSFSNKL
jgi:hypothetical protein